MTKAKPQMLNATRSQKIAKPKATTKPTNGHAVSKKRAPVHSKKDRMRITAETIGLPIAKAAKRLGLGRSTVSLWRAEYRAAGERQLDNIIAELRSEPAKSEVTTVAQAVEALLSVLKVEARTQIIGELITAAQP